MLISSITHTPFRFRVRDFGKGIPVERIRSFRDRGTGMGVGLGGRRERVRELGGTLRIEPFYPSGTIIVIEIPLMEDNGLLSHHSAWKLRHSPQPMQKYCGELTCMSGVSP